MDNMLTETDPPIMDGSVAAISATTDHPASASGLEQAPVAPAAQLPEAEKAALQASTSSLASASSDSNTSLNSADDDPNDAAYTERPSHEIEEELFRAIQDTDGAAVRQILVTYPPSQLLQILLTYSYVNRPPHAALDMSGSKATGLAGNNASALRERAGSLTYDASSALASPPATSTPQSSSVTPSASSRRLSSLSNQSGVALGSAAAIGTSIKSLHNNSSSATNRPYFTLEPEVMQEAHELLGTSVTPLSFTMIACMLGDEDIAEDLAGFVYKQTAAKRQKLLLMEFLGKVWGDGNTILHLASFQGMSDLVKTLIQYGANTNKRNGRGYRAVDCADDDLTRGLFRSINDVERLPFFDDSAATIHTQKKPSSSHGTSEHKYSSLPRKLTASKATMMASLKEDTAHEPSPSSPQIGGNKGSIASGSFFSPETSTPIHTSKSLTSLSSVGGGGGRGSISGMSCSTPSSLRRGSKSREAGRAARVKWDPNTMLLDCAKNGELSRIIEILAMSSQTADNGSGIGGSGAVDDTSRDRGSMSSVHTRRSSVYGPEKFLIDINYHSGHSALTPLHMACAYGHLDVAKFLIEDLKADVTVRDAEGWTALHSLIAEIPEPVMQSGGNQSPNQNLIKERKERERFLAVLRYIISLPAFDLRAETGDGESIVDVVNESEDTGETDAEVLRIIEEALKSRGIELRHEQSTGSCSSDDITSSAALAAENKPNDNEMTGTNTNTNMVKETIGQHDGHNDKALVESRQDTKTSQAESAPMNEVKSVLPDVLSSPASILAPQISQESTISEKVTENEKEVVEGSDKQNDELNEPQRVDDGFGKVTEINAHDRPSEEVAKKDTIIQVSEQLTKTNNRIETISLTQKKESEVSVSTISLLPSSPSTFKSFLKTSSTVPGRHSAPPANASTPPSSSINSSTLNRRQTSSVSQSSSTASIMSNASATDAVRKPSYTTMSLNRQPSNSGTFTKKASLPREPVTSIFAAPKALFTPPPALNRAQTPTTKTSSAKDNPAVSPSNLK